MAAVLSTVVLAAVVGLYVFSWRAWTRIGGRQLASQRADEALRAVLADARQALAYEIQPRRQGTALALTLPADDDGDGRYVPVAVNGQAAYRPGPRYVYYLSDATGGYGRAGDALWRGSVRGGAAPSQATVTPDTAWSVYYDTDRPRYDGLVGFEPAAGPGGAADQYFTCAITAQFQPGEADSPSVTISSGALLRYAQFAADSGEDGQAGKDERRERQGTETTQPGP